MVAQERINVRETVGTKNNCKLNFFSLYFVRTNEEIHLSFKNSENSGQKSFKMSKNGSFFVFAADDGNKIVSVWAKHLSELETSSSVLSEDGMVNRFWSYLL